MKERDILFSAPMVRTILEGRKTVTRRVVKLPPAPDHLGEWQAGTIGADMAQNSTGRAIPLQGCIWHTRTGKSLMCPYGQPGDRLWVRETFFQMPHPADCGLTRDAIPHSWDSACADAGRLIYRADRGAEIAIDGMRWKPSIHMHRAASRITLEVTGVRVERLNQISESDAQAEGAEPSIVGDSNDHLKYRAGFYHLWESINGEGSWHDNPWVWVVEFKRVTP